MRKLKIDLEVVPDGIEPHRQVLYALKRRLGTWEDVAEALPFEVAGKTCALAARDKREQNVLSKKYHEAIVDYWKSLETPPEEGLLVLFQCVDKLQAAIDQVQDRLKEEKMRNRHKVPLEMIGKLAGRLSDQHAQLENARKILRRKVDQMPASKNPRNP
jgi:hypothetical protein